MELLAVRLRDDGTLGEMVKRKENRERILWILKIALHFALYPE